MGRACHTQLAFGKDACLAWLLPQCVRIMTICTQINLHAQTTCMLQQSAGVSSRGRKWCLKQAWTRFVVVFKCKDAMLTHVHAVFIADNQLTQHMPTSSVANGWRRHGLHAAEHSHRLWCCHGSQHVVIHFWLQFSRHNILNHLKWIFSLCMSRRQKQQKQQ